MKVISSIDFNWIDKIPDGINLFLYSKDLRAKDKRYFPIGDDWGQVDRLLYAKMFNKENLKKALASIIPQLPEDMFIQVRDAKGTTYCTYPDNIQSSHRKINSSQKGFENVVEGTVYDDYHIDTTGQGILDVEHIINEIEGRGNQAVLTVQTSDGRVAHTQFNAKDWKEYKDAVNGVDDFSRNSGTKGAAITDVWVTEVEGGSYVRNSRRPIKSALQTEVVENFPEYMVYYAVYGEPGGDITDEDIQSFEEWRERNGYGWCYGFADDNVEGSFDSHPAFGLPCDTIPVVFKKITSSRKPIKSSKVSDIADEKMISFEDVYSVFEQYGYEDYKGEAKKFLNSDIKDVQDKFDEMAELKVMFDLEDWSDNEITSARFLVEDENGEVIGEADTYEEAESLGGTIIVDSESQEMGGQEDMNGVFQSREIKSAVDFGWEVRTSDAMKALDLFIEYAGEEEALESLARALSTDDLKENLEWIAQQWGFAEEIEDLDNAWDKYETCKELMGTTELLNNLSQAIGYDELAADMAFIFRMNDFREWDEVSGYDDEEEYHDPTEIDEDKQDYCLFDFLYNAYGKDMAQPIEDAIYDAECFDEIFVQYESEGGEYTEEDDPCFDNKELAAKVVNNVLDSYGIDVSTIQPKSSEVTNSRSFPVKTVKNILSGVWTEEQAANNISQKQNINVGYARQILSSWIDQYKPKLIKSGILDIAEDINTEFDIDGDLESWGEQYTNDSGKSNTVGGEMVRAANQIIYRYNNDGDMIGRGYGNESVNAAARYITEKAEMGVNEQIQKWLDHEERADDNDYYNFIETFTTEIEQILRENPELFQKPNKDDFWDWKEDDDMNYGLDECYLDDGNGNQYWFQLDSGDRWYCTGIELDPYSITYSEGDRIYEDDEYVDEIDPTEEFGSFEADGFIYEYAGDDFDDEKDQYVSWQVTKVTPVDPYCDEGDTFDFYDFEPDELMGYTLYDHNGNEIDERTFLASSLIKSNITSGDEVVIEIERHGKWEIVAQSDDERGWTLKGDATPAIFDNKADAKNSQLAKDLARDGYSPNQGNMRFKKYS